MSGFRVGDVVRYRSERANRWCREETAIAATRRDGLVFVDTYWGCASSEDHILTAGELAAAELLFNLDDYNELDRRNSWEWERYAPADRQVITSQHGLQRRYFVLKDAREHLPTQVENARTRLAEAEGKLRSAEWGVEFATRELAQLEAQAAALADLPAT